MPYIPTVASGSAIATTPSSIVPPSSKVLGHGNDHTQHSERLFIGPMPFTAAERNIKLKGSGSKRRWWLGQHDVTSSDGSMEDNIPERHAFLYFLRRGGIKEDWESQESLRKR